jgi:hypothetical protein
MSSHIKYALVHSVKGNRYVASSDGHLFLVKQIKPGIGKQGRGYMVVATFDVEGNKRYRTLHSIIAECFIGPRPKGLTINHKDGNRWNNASDNLEYISGSENVKHAFRLGLRRPDTEHLRRLANARIGQRATNRRFSDAEATEIIALYRSGEYAMKELGERHGVSASSIHRIVHGKTVYQYIPR